jgi:protein SCO1
MQLHLLFRWPLSAISVSLLLSAVACTDNEGSAGRPLNRSAKETGTLPELSRVPEFSFRNQNDQPWGSRELAGKPYLAAFMFTRCPSICPALTARMKEIDAAVKKSGQSLQLISISVDPENDSPPVLKAYANKHGAAEHNWAFLTGDYQAIAKTSEEGFKVGLSGTVDESKPHLGITHGSHLILVDGKGTIRGYFRSSDDETVTAVVDALGRL